MYEVHSLSLDVGGEDKGKEIRNLVVVKDCSGFILQLIKERGLNPGKTLVRVSIDGGQGFLKFCANVFEPEELDKKAHEIHSNSARELGDGQSSNYLGSGVQKIQILAMAEDTSETYENMRTILDLLNLENLGYNIGNQTFLCHSGISLGNMKYHL